MEGRRGFFSVKMGLEARYPEGKRFDLNKTIVC